MPFDEQEDTADAHYQASFKTTMDSDGGPFLCTRLRIRATRPQAKQDQERSDTTTSSLEPYYVEIITD